MSNSLRLINVSQRTERVLPLGALTLLPCLERKNIRTTFHDFKPSRAAPSSLDAIGLADAMDGPEDYIGISCMYDCLPQVLFACETVRARSPKKTIILGGPGPSVVGPEIIKHFKSVNCVIVGPGEAILPKLLASDGAEASLNSVIAAQCDDRVVFDGRKTSVNHEDWESQNFYETIDLSGYSHIGMLIARGCPFSCRFCSVAAVGGDNVILRSTESVDRDLDTIRSRGVQKIDIWDDTFGFNKRAFNEFCSLMKNNYPDMKWTCNLTTNIARQQTIETLAEAGCRHVFFGLESGSDAQLKLMGKKTTAAQAISAVRSALDVIGGTTVSFIWGFPDESHEDFFVTAGLMSYLKAIGADVRHSRLAPLPGTSIYQVNKDHLICPERKNLKDGLLQPVRGDMPDELYGLLQQFPEIFGGFYLAPSPVMEITNDIISNLKLLLQ